MWVRIAAASIPLRDPPWGDLAARFCHARSLSFTPVYPAFYAAHARRFVLLPFFFSFLLFSFSLSSPPCFLFSLIGSPHAHSRVTSLNSFSFFRGPAVPCAHASYLSHPSPTFTPSTSSRTLRPPASTFLCSFPSHFILLLASPIFISPSSPRLLSLSSCWSPLGRGRALPPTHSFAQGSGQSQDPVLPCSLSLYVRPPLPVPHHASPLRSP